MIATISCAALMGIDAFKVQLEVDFSRSGMPCFTMVERLYPMDAIGLHVGLVHRVSCC